MIFEKSQVSLEMQQKSDLKLLILTYEHWEVLSCFASEWNWTSPLKCCITSGSFWRSFALPLRVFKSDCRSLAMEMSSIRDAIAMTMMAMAHIAKLNVNTFWIIHATTYPARLFVWNGSLKSDSGMNIEFKQLKKRLIFSTHHMISGSFNAPVTKFAVKKAIKPAAIGVITGKINFNIRVDFWIFSLESK